MDDAAGRGGPAGRLQPVRARRAIHQLHGARNVGAAIPRGSRARVAVARASHAAAARRAARTVPGVPHRRRLGMGRGRVARPAHRTGLRCLEARRRQPGIRARRPVRAARHGDRRELRAGAWRLGRRPRDRRGRSGRTRGAPVVSPPRPLHAGDHRYVVPIPAPPRGAPAQRNVRTAMEVILREDRQHLGKAGEVVKVKDGYARNFLLPQGKAYPATDANKKKIAYEADRLAKQRATEKAAAETEATRLTGVSLSFPAKVGEEDKLYGSVTPSDIQRKLEELGIHVDKRKIDLPEPIRALGEFRVGIKIHPDVRPEIVITVVKE